MALLRAAGALAQLKLDGEQQVGVQIIARAVSRLMAMLASVSPTAWCRTMGLPPDTRSLAYLMEASRQACAMPTDWLAMPMRPASRIAMATGKPRFTSPSTLAAGTRS